MMITFILWIDCRQADAAQQQRQREGLLIDKSIEFKASAGSVHCLKSLLLLGSLKKCDKPSFEQLWASLVHYGSPTTILSTDKTALASLLYAKVFLSLLIIYLIDFVNRGPKGRGSMFPLIFEAQLSGILYCTRTYSVCWRFFGSSVLRASVILLQKNSLLIK